MTPMEPLIQPLESRTLMAADPDVVGNAPQVNIAQPNTGLLYQGGMRLRFAGNAFDVEDGKVPAGRITWSANLVGGGRLRNLGIKRDVTSGAYVIPTNFTADADQELRVTMVAKDSDGNVTRETVVLEPRVADVTVSPNFDGVKFVVDGTAFFETTTLQRVVGMDVDLTAARNVRLKDGRTFTFDRWSGRSVEATGRTTATLNTGVGGDFVVAVYRLTKFGEKPIAVEG
jgi:hypothetical protein